MAEVQLTCAEATGSGGLPPVCMECGAPATTEKRRKYSTDRALLPPPDPLLGGCVLFPLWLAIALIRLISWSSARTMEVQTPLCDRHAHGWFTWSELEATSITDEGIVLTGVSEEFAKAWHEQRAAERPRERVAVKVRCRSCRALNDEGARFCNQCGEPM